MGSLRHLTSVADGTATSFASRTNDFDGWWALGLLLDALPPADPDYHLDLLTGEATPAGLPQGLDGLGKAWARYFQWSVRRHGVRLEAVRTAVLTLRFDRTRDVPSWIRFARDHPFTCTVTIEDDRGRSHDWIGVGHCSRLSDFPDPETDLSPQRSTGQRDPRFLPWIDDIGDGPRI